MVEQATNSGIRNVSKLDSLRFTIGHLGPVFLQGLFTRNRAWVGFFSLLHTDPLSVRFVNRIRKKYNAHYLYLQLGRTQTLLVLDNPGIKNVLDNSPAKYAEPPAKRNGMSRFQPRALTISRGVAWQDRRRFNEAVLDSGNKIHRNAEQFLAIVNDECKSMLETQNKELQWNDFKKLFERISLQVIFGRAAVDDHYLMRSLNKLMRNANLARFLPPRKRLYESFSQAVGGYLRWPEPGSLVADARGCPSSSLTAVENQIPHWMFAMNETLATNTFRALALIAAFEDVQSKLRQNLESANLDRAKDIAAQIELTGCLQEAMRLWPTTPIMMRETTQQVALGGQMVPEGTQVMIFNSFNHRDKLLNSDADKFVPQRWIQNPINDQFNHLSNGSQECAGKHLALWLGTAVLAVLLRQASYRLVKPKLDPGQPIPHAMNYFRTRLVFKSLDEVH